GRDGGRSGHRADRRRRGLGPRYARAPEPRPGDHPAAAVRVSRGAGAGHGRRPAEEPREVGHGRVARGPGPRRGPPRPTEGRTRGSRSTRWASISPDMDVPPGTTELGIDIIQVSRIQATLAKFGRRFSRRVLTE